MSNRGQNEPEYIDDEDYFDPDAEGASRPASNVLGGSGSRYSRDPVDDEREDAAAGAGRSGSQRNRGAKRGGVKSRNPAPAVVSSAERRARLAGKSVPSKKPAPASKGRSKAAQSASEQTRPAGRLSSIRARFSRGNRAEAKPSPSAERSKSIRAARLVHGFRAHVGGLYGRLASKVQSDRNAQERRPQGRRGGSQSPAGARGGSAGRGSTKPANAKSTAAYAAGRVREQGSNAERASGSKAPRLESANWLDLDRKLDLIGVALAFGAIALTFSALSAEQATIGALHQLIGQALGWGAFAVPVVMFAVGMWLLIRHFGDEAPTVDAVRLSGIGLAFLGALVAFQFLDSLTYGDAMQLHRQCGDPTSAGCVDALVQHSYQDGRGGGLIGGWLYSALVNNLTELGAFVIVIMLLTFATMMITRLSIAELTVLAIGLGRNLRTRVQQLAAQRRAQRLASLGTLDPAQSATDVRVSKPAAPRLSAAGRAGALPAPNVESMPIPERLLELFRWPRRFAGRAEARLPLAEAVAAAPEARDSESLKPFVPNYLKRGGRFEKPREPASPPHAGYIERFLNLGDDLPGPAAAAPSAGAVEAEPQATGEATRAPAMPDVNNGGGDEAQRRAAPHKPAKPRTMPPTDRPAPNARESTGEDKPAAADSHASTNSDSTASMTVAAPDRADVEPTAEAVDGSAGDANALASSTPSRPRKDWDVPAYRELLTSGSAGEMDQEPLMRQAQIIEDTLASFGAPGRVVEINSGPVITQYGVEPGYLTSSAGKRNRVKVGAIAKLDKDLQLALGARSVRMEAPVPGKGYVGIELPNPDTARVSLRDVMESDSYQSIESPLAIALGMSVDGTPISADLTQMPHLLIAGTTGSGKSVCVNAIINSILATNSPDTVKFIMVDPKRVELTGYNGLPHLVAPVVVELERIVGVLRWVTSEMDERYKKFSRSGARNIIDFNSILDPDLAPMPYIVVIIDELADLMMMAPDDTERAIARIAALARATGIHLVIATQRPSVDVVTGLIKANCPARIAFAVAGSIDSRVILDQPGAERLLGKGDMLYLSGDSPAPLRMQGVHVSNEEIDHISRFWKLQGAGLEDIKPISLPPPKASTVRAGAAPNVEISEPQRGASEQAAFWDMSPQTERAGSLNPDEDDLYETAVEMVRRLEKASISLLQRRLRIGYTRAARLVDMMEERGVVGPPKEGSSKPRDVLPVKPPAPEKTDP